MTFKKTLQGLFVAAWVVGTSILMSYLAALHGVSFLPDSTLLASHQPANWTMTHVLGPDCKCSAEVLSYLLKRGPSSRSDELVLLLGQNKDYEQQLSERGFKVDHRDVRSLASEKAVGVPFLMIQSPQGETVYAGGYANGFIKAGTPIMDEQILAYLQGGKAPQELPIFGCAVSQRIRSLIDPLGLKYQESL